jgi:hypothetical protein
VIPESEEVARHRLRRGTMLMLLALLLVTLFVKGTATTSSRTEACPAGQVASVSKYAGNTCMAQPSKAGKAVQSTVTGCVVGVFGGTLASILGGCAVGAVGAI